MARGRIRLSGGGTDSPFAPFKRTISSLASARTRAGVGKVLLRSWRVEGLPLRVRPAFILLTVLSLMVLSLLGFHPTLAQRLAPPAIPLSDKILHFFAFGLASAEFYACWVVDDQARARVWMWRHFNEGLSGIVCVLFGGIVSEFVQSLLPYKTFQWGDVIANLLGSSLGIFIARRLTQYHRRQAEIRRLYQPVHLSTGLDDLPDSDSDDDEGDELIGQAEMEEGRGRAEAQLGLDPRRGSRRQAKVEDNPWEMDDTDSLFGVGEDDDEEDRRTANAEAGGRTL